MDLESILELGLLILANVVVWGILFGLATIGFLGIVEAVEGSIQTRQRHRHAAARRDRKGK